MFGSVDAATCNISRRVEVSRLSKQPAFRAFNPRILVGPEGEVINLKNDPAREFVQGYLLHRGEVSHLLALKVML